MQENAFFKQAIKDTETSVCLRGILNCFILEVQIHLHSLRKHD